MFDNEKIRRFVVLLSALLGLIASVIELTKVAEGSFRVLSLAVLGISISVCWIYLLRVYNSKETIVGFGEEKGDRYTYKDKYRAYAFIGLVALPGLAFCFLMVQLISQSRPAGDLNVMISSLESDEQDKRLFTYRIEESLKENLGESVDVFYTDRDYESIKSDKSFRNYARRKKADIAIWGYYISDLEVVVYYEIISSLIRNQVDLVEPLNNNRISYLVDSYDDTIELRYQVGDDLSAYSMILMGILQVISRNEKEAIDYFTKGLDLNSDLNNSELNKLGYFYRGLAYTNLSRHEEAANDYTQVIMQDSLFENAFNNRGGMFNRLGRYEEALSDLDKAIELDPSHSSAYNNRGATLTSLGRYQEALLDLDKALELGSFNLSSIHNNRGTLFMHLNQPGEAIEAYRESIRNGKNIESAHANSAAAYYSLGEYEKAISEMNKAPLEFQESSRFYSNRGGILVHLQRYEEAIVDLNKALEYDSTNTSAMSNKASALLHSGRSDEALSVVNDALATKSSKSHEVHTQFGYILTEFGHFDEALDNYNKAIEADSTFGVAYSNRGGTLIHLGRYEEAISDLNKALELDSTNINAINSKGSALLYLGMKEEAVIQFDKAIEIRESFDPPYINAAKMFMFESRYHEAIEYLNRLILISPNNEQALVLRGISLDHLERYEQALWDFSSAIKISPNESQNYFLRGSVYLKLGKGLEGKKDLQKAQELGFDPNDAEFKINNVSPNKGS